jgi:DNA-binding MarR family transcriptional regulator
LLYLTILIEFNRFLTKQANNMQKYEELLVSLRKVIRAVGLYSKKLSKETGLTSPQLIVLREINLHDGIMVKEIAKQINLSSATVTSILDRLEGRSLVLRERSIIDKRRVGLHLTEAGCTAIQDSPRPLQQHFTNRFEALENWEQAQMLATMQRIAKMMDAETLDAGHLFVSGTNS